MDIGLLAFWYFALLAWPTGLAYWSADLLAYWHTGLLTYWPTDLLVYWHTGPLTHWPGLPA